MTPGEIPTDDAHGCARRCEEVPMNEQMPMVNAGDVIEFTLRDERVTAVVMLVSDEGAILLDLLDEGGLAWGDVDRLTDLAVFRPQRAGVAAAA
jgi:hypothetical protein